MADLPNFYSDHVMVATSDYGVTVLLGLTQPFGGKGDDLPSVGGDRPPQLRVEGQAQVRLSLAHAKCSRWFSRKT